MKYEVCVVGDEQLAAEWVLVSRGGVFILFVRAAYDTPATHRQAMKLMLTLAA